MSLHVMVELNMLQSTVLQLPDFSIPLFSPQEFVLSAPSPFSAFPQDP